MDKATFMKRIKVVENFKSLYCIYICLFRSMWDWLNFIVSCYDHTLGLGHNMIVVASIVSLCQFGLADPILRIT